jgi:hypothetical protein
MVEKRMLTTHINGRKCKMKLTDDSKKQAEVAENREEAGNAIIQQFLEGQSEEDLTKVRNCQSHEELAALANEKAIKLSDEQLEAVSGGINWPDCPTYQPGQNAPIPEALSNNPRVVHLIRSNVTL